MGHAGHPGAYPGRMKHKKMKASWGRPAQAGQLGCMIQSSPVRRHAPVACCALLLTRWAHVAPSAPATSQYKGAGGWGRHKFKGGKFKRGKRWGRGKWK